MSEVYQLKDKGVAEETIVAFVRSHHLDYELSAEDVVALRERGVPVSVMNAMLESGGASDAPAPGPGTATGTAAEVISGPAAPASPPADQEVAYFRQELSPYGRWLISDESQWYWQPAVAAGNSTWRPYWDQGRWVYTDHGWYWSSDYAWGWAAFHYGRWSLHPHHGWIWYPDREWAPAWVTWRMGGDYCGWAPLPPYTHFDRVRGGLSFHGRQVEANFGFGLEWRQFNFSYLREMGDRPRPRFRQEADARRIFGRTTVINNFSIGKTAGGSDSRPRLVNQGIDPARVGAVRGRPVETVKIQDRRIPAPGRVAERVDARTKTLDVDRPQLAQPSPAARSQPKALRNPRAAGAPTAGDARKDQPANARPAPIVLPAPAPRSVVPLPRGGPSEVRPGTPAHPAEPEKAVGAPNRSAPGRSAEPPRKSPGKAQDDSKSK